MRTRFVGLSRVLIWTGVDSVLWGQGSSWWLTALGENPQMYSTWFAPYEALAACLLKHVPPGGDGSHDVSHLIRVWKNASIIRLEEGGDARILVAGVLLHDCVHVEKTSPARSEASRLSATKASEILSQLGWSQDCLRRVEHSIRAHSFSAGITPESIEAKILQDADRLDAMGMIGVARCFNMANKLGQRLYELTDPAAKRGREFDDSSYALDHFQTKLFKLVSGFQTATGQYLAKERHERLQRFFEEFLGEI